MPLPAAAAPIFGAITTGAGAARSAPTVTTSRSEPVIDGLAEIDLQFHTGAFAVGAGASASEAGDSPQLPPSIFQQITPLAAVVALALVGLVWARSK